MPTLPRFTVPVVAKLLGALILCAALPAGAVTAFLQGEALYLARIMPPSDAVLVVTLEDVLRADARSREIASARIAVKAGPPYAWRIAYDPAMVDGHGQALRARIDVAGKLWMTTETHYPAFGPAARDKPELLLRMVDAASATGPATAPVVAGCAGVANQLAMNDCAQKEFLAAGQSYSTSYKALAAKLGAKDRKQLIRMQRAWISYRTAACDFEAGGVAGGSAQAMVRSQCATRLTRARTSELEKLANCPEGDLGCARVTRQTARKSLLFK